MPYGIPPYGVDVYGNPVDADVGDLVYAILPGVYVDSLIFDEVSEGLFLYNTNPTNGQVDVSKTALVEFDIFDTSGSDVDPSTLIVTINGVPAITNGAAIAPFNGGGSSVGVADPSLHVVIDYTGEYDSEGIVEVHVWCENVAQTYTLDAVYSFQIEDYVPPKVLSAEARSEKVVRVVFDDDMNMDDTTSDASALNPANYSFTALSAPAVPLEPVSVARVSSKVVDITTDIEMTPNAQYRVTVVNAEDASGNVIVP